MSAPYYLTVISIIAFLGDNSVVAAWPDPSSLCEGCGSRDYLMFLIACFSMVRRSNSWLIDWVSLFKGHVDPLIRFPKGLWSLDSVLTPIESPSTYWWIPFALCKREILARKIWLCTLCVSNTCNYCCVLCLCTGVSSLVSRLFFVPTRKMGLVSIFAHVRQNADILLFYTWHHRRLHSTLCANNLLVKWMLIGQP